MAPESQTRLVDLGEATDFPLDEFTIVRVDDEGVRAVDRTIGVLRTGADEVIAVRNVCPHRGAGVCAGKVGGTLLPSEPGEFEFGLAGQVLRCPWHGYEFDLESGQALFTSHLRLTRFPATIAAGRIIVSLPASRRLNETSKATA